MNIQDIFLLVPRDSVKQLILLLYILLALFIAGYNWLYLYHSLHVSSKHMGLQAPSSIKFIIKSSIMMALFTAVLCSILLVTNIY